MFIKTEEGETFDFKARLLAFLDNRLSLQDLQMT